MKNAEAAERERRGRREESAENAELRGLCGCAPRPLRLQGQVVLEYFILFAAIAVISILGILVMSGRRLPAEVTLLDPTIQPVDLRGQLQAYFSKAAQCISAESPSDTCREKWGAGG